MTGGGGGGDVTYSDPRVPCLHKRPRRPREFAQSRWVARDQKIQIVYLWRLVHRTSQSKLHNPTTEIIMDLSEHQATMRCVRKMKCCRFSYSWEPFLSNYQTVRFPLLHILKTRVLNRDLGCTFSSRQILVAAGRSLMIKNEDTRGCMHSDGCVAHEVRARTLHEILSAQQTWQAKYVESDFICVIFIQVYPDDNRKTTPCLVESL